MYLMHTTRIAGLSDIKVSPFFEASVSSLSRAAVSFVSVEIVHNRIDA
jgi:hypothetical protein